MLLESTQAVFIWFFVVSMYVSVGEWSDINTTGVLFNTVGFAVYGLQFGIQNTLMVIWGFSKGWVYVTALLINKGIGYDWGLGFKPKLSQIFNATISFDF
jgi:hypothetical protein